MEEMLRAAVRDEVRSALAFEREAYAACSQAGREPEEEDLGPEAVRAHAEARAIVARARAAGRWTAEDRSRLVEELRHLNTEQHRDVLGDLVGVLNRKEMVSDLPHPL